MGCGVSGGSRSRPVVAVVEQRSPVPLSVPKAESQQRLWNWWKTYTCGQRAMSGRSVALPNTPMEVGISCNTSGCLTCDRTRLRKVVAPLRVYQTDVSVSWHLLTLTSPRPVASPEDVVAFLAQLRQTVAGAMRQGWLLGGSYVVECTPMKSVPEGVVGSISCPHRGELPDDTELSSEEQDDIKSARIKARLCKAGNCDLCGGTGMLPVGHVHAHLVCCSRGRVHFSSDDGSGRETARAQEMGHRFLALPFAMMRAPCAHRRREGDPPCPVHGAVLHDGCAAWSDVDHDRGDQPGWELQHGGMPCGLLAWAAAWGWGRVRDDVLQSGQAAAVYVSKAVKDYVAKGVKAASTEALYQAAYIRSVVPGARTAERFGFLRGMDASWLDPARPVDLSLPVREVDVSLGTALEGGLERLMEMNAVEVRELMRRRLQVEAEAQQIPRIVRARVPRTRVRGSFASPSEPDGGGFGGGGERPPGRSTDAIAISAREGRDAAAPMSPLRSSPPSPAPSCACREAVRKGEGPPERGGGVAPFCAPRGAGEGQTGEEGRICGAGAAAPAYNEVPACMVCGEAVGVVPLYWSNTTKPVPPPPDGAQREDVEDRQGAGFGLARWPLVPGELLSRAVEREWWMPWVLTSGEWGIALVGGKIVKTVRIGAEDAVEAGVEDDEGKCVDVGCVGGVGSQARSAEVEAGEDAGIAVKKPISRRAKMEDLEVEAVKGAVMRIARLQVGAMRSARARLVELEEDATWQVACAALEELLRRFSNYRVNRTRHYEAIRCYALYPKVREEDYRTLALFVTITP